MLITTWFRSFQLTLARKLSRGLVTNRRSRRRVDTVSRMECLENRSLLSATMIEIVPGSSPSNPEEMTDVGGFVYFRAQDATHGYELFRSDGTPGGTTLVMDIRSGSAGSFPQQLTNVNGVLYFVAHDGTAHGNELWMSDPMSGITALVKDINPGMPSSGISELTVMNNKLYFSANDGTNGPELWKSDGTASGTELVININPGTVQNHLGELTKVTTGAGSRLYFRADDGLNGSELWGSDGTFAGTKLVKNIFAANGGHSDPQWLTDVNGTLYFSAIDSLVNSGGLQYLNRELWKSDGTAQGTVLVADINGMGHSSPAELTNMNGTLFFRASNGGLGNVELWKSDGTAVGTVMVKNINTTTTPTFSSNPSSLTVVGNTLFFTANEGTASGKTGIELWKTDGTTAGTVRVKDIRTGTASSTPISLTNVGGTLYFAANNGTNGVELWKSDGTTAGTTLIQDIRLGASGANPTFLANVNLTSEPNTLFFSANNGTNGVELWKLCTHAPIAMFSAGVLTVTADECDDTITISRSGTNILMDYLTGLIDLTAAGIVTGALTKVELFGNGGNDFLKLDSSLGVAVSGVLEGSAGNDTLFGGLGKDTYLFSTNTQIGSDTVMDAGGLDTLDFSSSTSLPSVNVNLGTNVLQTVNPNLKLKLNTNILIENATGSSGADTLMGNSLDNFLVGGPGNDTLFGIAANDTLFGDGGSDELDGGANNDLLAGGSDDDTLLGVAGNDELRGDGGDDSLAGGVGNDSLNGGDDNDQLFGDVGNDTLSGGLGKDWIDGGANNDSLTGGADPDTLKGGTGNDTLTGEGGNDSLDGGTNNDTYVFDTNSQLDSDTVTDATGIDLLDFSASTLGVKVHLGVTTPQTVNINHMLTLVSNSSIENVTSGSGRDTLTGNGLDNILISGTAQDSLTGGGGSDSLKGGSGSDVYFFDTAIGTEVDKYAEHAGEGGDTLVFYGMTTAVTVNLLSSTNTATMLNRTVRSDPSDTLSSVAHIENAYGGSGNDTLTGNAAANVMYSRAGNDVMYGGDGNDKYLFDNPVGAELDTVVELLNQGNDTLDFSVSVPVTADLTSDTATATMGFLPVLLANTRIVQTGPTTTGLVANIENLQGGSGDDTLVGNSSSNTLVGREGNDWLEGRGGDDFYHFLDPVNLQTDTVVEVANGGTDLLDFTDATVPVVVDLMQPVNLGTMGVRTLNGSGPELERVVGGTNDDILIGNLNNNDLQGGAGNDILVGGGGADTLRGGNDNDILVGGLGADSLNGNGGEDIVIAGDIPTISTIISSAVMQTNWFALLPFATRVTSLSGTLVANSTVIDDTGADTVVSNEGTADWLFANTGLDDTLNTEGMDTLTAIF